MTQHDDARPLAAWDDDNSSHPSLVWWSRLDGRYLVEVHRTGNYSATLYIFDHHNGDALIHREENIGLAYGARFGPDVDDVSLWQEKAAEVVDNLNSHT